MATTTETREQRVDKYVALDALWSLLDRLARLSGTSATLRGVSPIVWEDLVLSDGTDSTSSLFEELFPPDDSIDNYYDESAEYRDACRRSSLLLGHLLVLIANDAEYLRELADAEFKSESEETP